MPILLFENLIPQNIIFFKNKILFSFHYVFNKSETFFLALRITKTHEAFRNLKNHGGIVKNVNMQKLTLVRRTVFQSETSGTDYQWVKLGRLFNEVFIDQSVRQFVITKSWQQSDSWDLFLRVRFHFCASSFTWRKIFSWPAGKVSRILKRALEGTYIS